MCGMKFYKAVTQLKLIKKKEKYYMDQCFDKPCILLI